jgi:AraC family transcriptional regulator
MSITQLRTFTCRHVVYEAGARCTSRSLDAATLEVVIRGTLERTSGRRRFMLHRGSALFKPSGIAGTAFSEAGAESLVIEVQDVALRETVADGTARAWSLNLLREAEVRDPGWELLVEGLILQGLGWLTRCARLRSERPAWLDDVVELARRQQPLGTIAASVNRHASHVAREFRRHEGVSVGEFSRRCRLELAAVALMSADQSIVDVALTAGFCDQSHFTNAFRRVFGVTPAAYRVASADGGGE